MLVKTLIKHLQDYYELEDEICSIIWTKEDIVDRAKDQGNKVPSKERLSEIINLMDKNHDCNYGITWETIDYYLEDTEE